MNKTLRILLALLLAALLGLPALAESQGDILTDYSDPANWAVLPDEITRDVDTFFIYPTVYINAEEGAPDYAPIGDPLMVNASWRNSGCFFMP